MKACIKGCSNACWMGRCRSRRVHSGVAVESSVWIAAQVGFPLPVRPLRWKFECAPGRIRTCDHPLRRRVLYPAELRAHAGTNLRRFDKKWSEWRDSNPRHSAPKTDALPGCATLRRLKTDCVSSGAHNNGETGARQRKKYNKIKYLAHLVKF